MSWLFMLRALTVMLHPVRERRSSYLTNLSNYLLFRCLCSFRFILHLDKVLTAKHTNKCVKGLCRSPLNVAAVNFRKWTPGNTDVPESWKADVMATQRTEISGCKGPTFEDTLLIESTEQQIPGGKYIKFAKIQIHVTQLKYPNEEMLLSLT